MKLIDLILLFTLSFSTAYAQIDPAEQQYLPAENLLLNPGFENGQTNWTRSGTATFSLETAAPISGKRSLKIVASSQTFDVSQVSTKYASINGGTQGIVLVTAINSNPLAQICAVVDSVDLNCITMGVTTSKKEYAIPFIMGSTNNGVRVKAASSSGTTTIDSVSVGAMPATMTPEISQAQIAGEAYIAGTANCLWGRASATLGAFGTDADCPGPTIAFQNIGSWQTTDSDLPRFTVNNLPAGEYLAVMNTPSYSAAISDNAVTIFDGTSTCQATASNGYNSASTSVTVSCRFNYTSSGNRSFELYGASQGSTIQIDNNTTAPNTATKFTLYYYPPKSKIYSGDTIYPHAQVVGTVKYASTGTLNVSGTPMTNNSMTVSVTGDVLNICSDWSLGTGSGCNTGNKSMGASFIAVNRGIYEICTTYNGYNTGAAANLDGFTISARTFNLGSGTALQTFEGNQWGFATNYGGRYSVHEYCQRIENPTAGRVNFAVISSGTTYAYPVLFNGNPMHTTVKYFPPKDNPIIGTFANVVTAPNIAKPKTCYYAFGGAGSVVTGMSECTSGVCTEVYDNCSAIMPPTRTAAGSYASVVIANGTFKANSFISCDCQAMDNDATGYSDCSFESTGGFMATNSSGGISLVVRTFLNGVGLNDTYVRLNCTADAP